MCLLQWPLRWCPLDQTWSRDLDTGLWLAEPSHVTWILASDWPRHGQRRGSHLFCSSVDIKQFRINRPWIVLITQERLKASKDYQQVRDQQDPHRYLPVCHHCHSSSSRALMLDLSGECCPHHRREIHKNDDIIFCILSRIRETHSQTRILKMAINLSNNLYTPPYQYFFSFIILFRWYCIKVA